MEAALSKYHDAANSKYGKGSGYNVPALLLKHGPMGQYSVTCSFLILADGEQMSKPRNRKIAEGKFKEDDVETEMVPHIAGKIASVSVSSSNVNMKDLQPGLVYTIRDWQGTHSLEPLKNEEGEKTGEHERRLYINAKAVTAIKSYKGARIRGNPDDYFSIFRRAGLVQLPSPYNYGAVPQPLEMAYNVPCVVFRTGVTKMGDHVLTVVQNQNPGDREISFCTDPGEGSKMPKSICFYNSYFADLDKQEGHVYNVRIYGEGLNFGFSPQHPEHMAIWNGCVGPALAGAEDVVFAGPLDYKATGRHGINTTNGIGSAGTEENGEPKEEEAAEGFDFGGKQDAANYPIKSTRVLQGAMFVDFQQVVRDIGLVISPDAAYNVWKKAKEERVPDAFLHDTRLQEAYGMSLLNNGNPSYMNILKAGEGDHKPNARFVAVLRVETNPIDSVKMNMTELNEAVEKGTLTVPQVIAYLEDKTSTGDKEKDKILMRTLTGVRGKAGRCTLDRCAVYMLATPPKTKPSLETYLLDNGYLLKGKEEKESSAPKKAKEEKKESPAPKEEKEESSSEDEEEEKGDPELKAKLTDGIQVTTNNDEEMEEEEAPKEKKEKKKKKEKKEKKRKNEDGEASGDESSKKKKKKSKTSD